MGWFTSNDDRRIEDIKKEVCHINEKLTELISMLNRGQDYCIQNSENLFKIFEDALQWHERLKQDLELIPPEKLANLRVAWLDSSLERHPIIFWDMSFVSTVKDIARTLDEWSNPYNI